MASLEDIEFAENPEPRCPCVLLLDTSGSMSGLPIDALNTGLQTFKSNLANDSLASRRVEVAIVTFDSTVEVVQDFVTADQFNPPRLVTGGSTSMAEGINKSLDLIDARKAQYRNNGVSYYRPWVFMITDGAPTDEAVLIQHAAQRVKDAERNKRVAFFAVGVEGADLGRLKEFSDRAPLKLAGLNFQELFVWLSASMQRVSQSKPDEQVALPPPGWAAV